MEPTYSVPPPLMALQMGALGCTLIGVFLLIQAWTLRGVRIQYLIDKRRGRAIAAAILLAIGVPVMLFGPRRLRNDRIEFQQPARGAGDDGPPPLRERVE